MDKELIIFLAAALFIISSGLFHAALALSWARRLHALHPEREVSTKFWMMIGPKTADSMSAEMWKDYRVVQRRHRITGLIVVLGGSATVVAIVKVLDRVLS